jgi:hypothetical protein
MAVANVQQTHFDGALTRTKPSLTQAVLGKYPEHF